LSRVSDVLLLEERVKGLEQVEVEILEVHHLLDRTGFFSTASCWGEPTALPALVVVGPGRRRIASAADNGYDTSCILSRQEQEEGAAGSHQRAPDRKALVCMLGAPRLTGCPG
jgi:hypothetical protein